MGAEREMSHADVALLLADAADGIEPGAAPCQAVMRGGKRRKARRWLAGAATALVLAGSTGSIAIAVVDGRDQTHVADKRLSPDERNVYSPARVQLAELFDKGGSIKAYVSVEVWGAPLSRTEAARQKDRMVDYGVWDERKNDKAPLLERAWSSVVVVDPATGRRELVSFGLVDKNPDPMGYESSEFTLKGSRLTVGQVGPGVKSVAFEYEDSTSEPELFKVPGTGKRWFLQDRDDSPASSEKPLGIRVYGQDGKSRTVAGQ
ncbi:hypothetical protein ACFQVC_30270 [Streptomyces monticola]|uniref:Tat pathway signal sequence domain protein n=1 Tax=Streptomyces monticola TaxID=2666263 RepID=A0ABW2JTH5_9ACTN